MKKIWSLSLILFFFFVYLTVLFVDLLPISLALGSYASQRFFLLFIISVISVIALSVLVRTEGCSITNSIWPVFLVSASFILLSLPHEFSMFNWAEPGMYALFFLGFVLAGRLPNRRQQRMDVVIALVGVTAIMATFYGMATITVYLFALSDNVVSLTDYIPWGFVNIRYWSHIATWILPLLPLAVLIGPLRLQRLWCVLVALGAALWWWIVFLSSSRGTMLGVIFGMLVVAILMGRLAMPWLKKSFRYFCYGVVAWLLLSVLIPSLLIDDNVVVRSLKADSSGRMPLFVEAWYMSLVEFPFGMGPQSWLTHEIITEGYRQSPKFGHPHNMYLMWAAEYGWLMVASILVLAAQAMYLFGQRRKEIAEDGAKSLALSAFTASVSAALLHAGVSAVFMAPGSMLVGFVVLSVFWVLISGERLDSKKKPTKRRTVAALVIALVGSGFCLIWIDNVRDYHAAMTNDEQVYYDGPSVGMLPRFWFHGNFPRYNLTEKD